MSMAIKRNGKSSLAQALVNLTESGSVLGKMQYKQASEGTSDFALKLEGFVKEVESKYRDGMDLTQEVVKIAERENLTDDEIDRAVQAINMRIYQICFDKTSGQEDRTVKFAIADPNEVKSKLGRGAKPSEPSTTDAPAPAPASGEEKVASLKRRDLASALLDYNSSAHETGYSAPEIKGAYQEYLFDKVAANISADLEKAAGIKEELEDGVKTLGVCFAKYASHGLDHQAIFEKMCSQSKLRKVAQLAVKEAFEAFKGEFKVAEEETLDLVDTDAVEDFSLGQHSVSGVGNENIATLPEVVDKKRQVRDFEKLVDIALKIQTDDELLDSINQKIEAKKQLIDSAIEQKPEGGQI